MTAPIQTQHLIARSLQQAPDYSFCGQQTRLSGASWMHPVCEVSTRGITDHVLVHHVAGSTRIERSRAGRVTGRHSRLGSSTFVSCQHESVWRVQGQAEVMHLYLPPLVLTRYAQDDGEWAETPEILEFFAADDPWLAGFFAMLRVEHGGDPAAAPGLPNEPGLLLDQLELSLARHLVLRHSNLGDAQAHSLARRQAQARLSPSRLHRVEAFMEAHYASPIQLRELSELVAMSRDHFVRAFRNTVGQTPYQYLLHIRLTRAGELLRRRPELPIALVAEQCGFKSAGHFSTRFGRQHGCSPTRYRLVA